MIGKHMTKREMQRGSSVALAALVALAAEREFGGYRLHMKVGGKRAKQNGTNARATANDSR
jgi:hypothetical protein